MTPVSTVKPYRVGVHTADGDVDRVIRADTFQQALAEAGEAPDVIRVDTIDLAVDQMDRTRL